MDGGGVTVTNQYDLLDRLVSRVWRDAQGAILRSLRYTYTPAGMIDTLAREDGGLADYDYDSLDRLTAVRTFDKTGRLTRDEHYAYDLAGNRLAKQRDGVTVDYSLGTSPCI
jgi:uncharacterized protein RhaS with RHS repeats